MLVVARNANADAIVNNLNNVNMPKSKRTKDQKRRSRLRSERLKEEKRSFQKKYVAHMNQLLAQRGASTQETAKDSSELNIDTGDFAL